MATKKTYEWLVGQRGNAHLCERISATEARPVCGKELKDFGPAAGEPSCPLCVREEKVVRAYMEAMAEKDEGTEGAKGT